MIHFKARAVKDADSLRSALLAAPHYVEISTPSGFTPRFDGYADKLPFGVLFYARQGKLTVSVRRVANGYEVK